jgi:hypothetical protein
VRLDRKLLLIAPTIVLLFVFAGLVYAAMELRVLTYGSDSLKERSDYIAAVERGEKTIEPQKAIGLLRFSLDAEAKRTAAITATRALLVELSALGFISCVVLAAGIRSVPREHWPRFAFQRSQPE